MKTWTHHPDPEVRSLAKDRDEVTADRDRLAATLSDIRQAWAECGTSPGGHVTGLRALGVAIERCEP